MFKILSILAMAVFVVVPSLAQEKAEGHDVELKGYIVDAMCAKKMAKKDDPMKEASMHTKSCALEEGCAESGYGVFSEGKWYKFDAAGDEMAMKLIKGTKTEKGIMVVVEGTMKGDQLAVAEIEESGMKSEEMEKEGDED